MSVFLMIHACMQLPVVKQNVFVGVLHLSIIIYPLVGREGGGRMAQYRLGVVCQTHMVMLRSWEVSFYT